MTFQKTLLQGIDSGNVYAPSYKPLSGYPPWFGWWPVGWKECGKGKVLRVTEDQTLVCISSAPCGELDYPDTFQEWVYTRKRNHNAKGMGGGGGGSKHICLRQCLTEGWSCWNVIDCYEVRSN